MISSPSQNEVSTTADVLSQVSKSTEFRLSSPLTRESLTITSVSKDGSSIVSFIAESNGESIKYKFTIPPQNTADDDAGCIKITPIASDNLTSGTTYEVFPEAFRF
jgi:hypothetical protein